MVGYTVGVADTTVNRALKCSGGSTPSLTTILV